MHIYCKICSKYSLPVGDDTMNYDIQPGSTKDHLIKAGLEELNAVGMQNFSTRHVAKSCGFSCAAPYKHFENTRQFIAEIFLYINQLYTAEQQEVLSRYADADSKTLIIQLSLHYIRFLIKYPQFRHIIMQNYSDCDPMVLDLRKQLSEETYKVVSRYCDEIGASEEVRQQQTFVIRSLVYGAAMFYGDNQAEFSDENVNMIASILERELHYC